MKNRPRHRSPDPSQRTMLESLELRRLLSASVVPSLSFNFSMGVSLNWTPAATASANLTAAPDGSLWYTSSNTVEHLTPGGLTATFAIPNSDDTITSLAITSDGTAWLAVSRGGSNQILRLTSAGTFVDAAPATADAVANLTTVGDALWFTLGNTLEKLTPGTDPVTQHIPGIGAFDALTSDAQGNTWFTATTPIGQGLVGKLTPTGTLTTFNVNADPTSIAASNGTLFFGDHNALWRIAPDGTLAKTALPGIDPKNLAPAPDGGIWFLSTQTDFPLAHLAPDGTLAQFSTTPQSAPNSLALTPDGTLWIMAPGALAALRPQTSVFADNLFAANNYSQATFAIIDHNGNTITFNTGNSGNLVTSTSGNAVSTNTSGGNTTSGLLTATTSTTETSSSTTTQPSSSTTTQPSTGDTTRSSPTPPTTLPAPRFPIGDPGAFDGEFTISPHAPLPDREPTPGNSHSQSNLGNNSKSTLVEASSPADAPHTAWITQGSCANIPLLAFVTLSAADPIAAAPQQSTTLNAVAAITQTPPQVPAANDQYNTHVPAPAYAPSNVDPSIPPATALPRWWKLAICMSSAAGIEFGRAGQRYFRL